MIVQRFLAAFFPAAVFLATRRLSLVGGETFLTEGKILVEPGWKAIYGSVSEEEGEGAAGPARRRAGPVRGDRQAGTPDQAAAPVQRGDPARPWNTRASLVEDELAEAMKLSAGTRRPPGRRSSKLINEKYVVREQRELVPTGKAFELMSLLGARQIDVLASPELTGEWE